MWNSNITTVTSLTLWRPLMPYGDSYKAGFTRLSRHL